MKKYAVIVAGGSGQRMGTEMPKQFLTLKGKPLLHYTIQSFLHAYNDIKIVLVLPQEHMEKGEHLLKQFGSPKSIRLVSGGSTRFHSVKNGLELVNEPSIIFVQDGVRCLVSKKLIQNCHDQAMDKGSAIPAVAATDSIRIEEGCSHHSIDRNKIRIVQTPQTFRSEILLKAFRQEYDPAFTDEATVVEAMGQKVYLIEGEYNNLKITRPLDLLIAEKLLESSSTTR